MNKKRLSIFLNLFIIFFFIISPSKLFAEQKAYLIKEIFAGFRAPEGSVYDENRNCYYISNINGSPLEKDNNGFISRIVTKDDDFITTSIIKGTRNIPIHAPKGMAVLGKYLFIADIDSVVICNLKTQKPVARIKIKGAVFLNDLVIDSRRNIYVSDTKKNYIFKIPKPYKKVKQSRISLKKYLKGPNGLFIHPLSENLWITSFYSKVLTEIDLSNGKVISQLKLPFSGGDGICRGLSDERIFITSFTKGYLARVAPNGTSRPEILKMNKEKLMQPADISYDRRRARIIVPLMKENKVIIYSIVR